MINEQGDQPQTNGYVLITFPTNGTDPDMTANLKNIPPGHVINTFTICLGLLLSQAPKKQRWKLRRQVLKLVRTNTKKVLKKLETLEANDQL